LNTQLVGELIRLRYKLMWARTRSRNGRIAIFFIGYLILVAVISVLSAGGFGAAALAVRSGKAELVTRLVLTSLFAQALLTTVMLGFGMSSIFSDLELRRYPVTAAERHLVRHLIGVIDPFWVLTLALEFGLVVGLYVLGAAGFGTGLLAILLLLPANYLAARIIGDVIDRLMQGPAGSAVMLVLVISLSFSGTVIPPLVKKYPGIGPVVVQVLSWTPPFGAAAAMNRTGAQAAAGFVLELGWVFGLAAALLALEQRKPRRRAAETTALSFDSFYDRIAAALGFEHAPLVAWWLRFYGRNGRFKAMLGLTLPLVTFLSFNIGTQKKVGPGLFGGAMGVFPVATFFATARFMVNQFGYLGGGYRRCFLLPVEPGVILRTGSYASMVLGAIFIPAGAILWSLFAPVPFDARQLVMLIASATAGLFFFHGIGLWTTLYGARRGNYNQSFGNDLSLLANIAIIGGVMTCVSSPMWLPRVVPGVFDPAHWWMWIAPPVVTAMFYRVSLGATSNLLVGKREQLMAIVEGKA
jgi:hypothetical protein